MSTRHIATTIQSAQNLFSPESVEQIIREAGTLAAIVKTTSAEILRNGELNARAMATRFEDNAAKARKTETRDGWREAARRAREASVAFAEAAK